MTQLLRKCMRQDCAKWADNEENYPQFKNRQFFCGWPHYLSYVRNLPDDDVGEMSRWDK